MKSGSLARGRAEQILVLQEKVKDLQSKINSESRSKSPQISERQLQKPTISSSREQKRLSEENKQLQSKQAEIKTKLDALQARIRLI
jgi:predicted  nucleic acid-binding Zn-ribbon protein